PRYASPRPNSAVGKLGELFSARLNSPTAASGFRLSSNRYADAVTAATPLGCSLSASSTNFCAFAVLPFSSARFASATSCSYDRGRPPDDSTAAAAAEAPRHEGRAGGTGSGGTSSGGAAFAVTAGAGAAGAAGVGGTA